MTSTPPRASHARSAWGRFFSALWALQLVLSLAVGAVGVFPSPLAGGVQNAAGPVASIPQSGERVVASRERSGERLGRVRSDLSGDGGHAPLLFAAVTLPVVAPADFVVAPSCATTEHAPRSIRFALHAPRGPPQQG